ncbi:MAG: carboxypeptidase regulatory-like domain-containing protein [Myxococcales bacterium]|nr:carboxypeptidase regulatory-like domain-containing protein [Myxococcales bacterium]
MKRFWLPLSVVLALALGAWWLWPDAEPAPVEPAVGSAPRRANSTTERSPAEPRGRVLGHVLRDGQPVAGARVTLRAAAPLVSLSLDDGAFLFDDVPAGVLYLSASAPGAASEVIGPLQLPAGGRLEGLTLVLVPAVRVEGRVVDLLTQKPVAGATVISASQALRTDEAGRFTLEGARAQTWLDVTAPGFLSRTEWVSLELALAGGRLDVVLTPASFLEGQVLESGAPVAAATVWAEQADGAHRGERSMTVFTDAQGRFAVESAAGGLKLTAVTPRGTRVKGPYLRLAVGERKQGLVLEAGDATSAEGVVRRGGVPLPGAQLAAVDATNEEVAAFATAGPDGRFRFDSLLLGRYLVQVRLGGFVAIAGPFEHQGEGRPWAVDVAEGGVLQGRVEPPSAGVRVRWRGGDWSGPAAETITDAQGAFRFEGLPAEWVSVDAEGPAGAATARARAGDAVVLTLQRGQVIVHLVDDTNVPVTDGMLLARSLETGAVRTHLLLAPDGVTRLELPNGPWELVLEVPGRGRSAPAQVTVTEKGAEVRLSLETSVTVRGTVRDAATQLPLAGARVEAFSGDLGRGTRVSVVTDARGEFQLPPVPRSANLVVRREGFAQQWRRAVDGDRWDVALQPLQGGPRPPDALQFEGVGMVLDANPAGARVMQVNEGGPAERAGVLAGDVVVAVDGAPVAGQPLQQIVNRIRGPAGTPVRLGFLRNGQPLELTIRRRVLTL